MTQAQWEKASSLYNATQTTDDTLDYSGMGAADATNKTTERFKPIGKGGPLANPTKLLSPQQSLVDSTQYNLDNMAGNIRYEDFNPAEKSWTDYLSGDDSVFSEGNFLGDGGMVQGVAGLGGSLLQGMNMLDQHEMNKKAMQSADLHNAGVIQMIGENNRQIALDKSNKSKLDAGW